MTAYPHLFSEWQIRNTMIKNRIVFPPTCPTWVWTRGTASSQSRRLATTRSARMVVSG